MNRSHVSRSSVIAFVSLSLCGATAQAQEVASSAPARPQIQFNRWEEDWSVLADPRTPRESLDALKYIRLSPSDPKVYLSFGAEVRERFESNDAANLGTGGSRSDDYLISRTELNADLHLGAKVQVFTQVESAFAPGKTTLSPVDQNRLDLEQGFVAVTEPLDEGVLKIRLGRQQFAFDLQRFVGVRDGPNVRQSFDALWADYERTVAAHRFYSQPVQNQDERAFDDYSSGRLTYGGVRVERQIEPGVSFTAYYSRFYQTNVTFPSAAGNEQRDIFDVRYAGTDGQTDWDVEAMDQTGSIGDQSIQAWAVGSVFGFTQSNVFWSPRLGMQIDAASGDTNPNDHHLGTFNPLFPNGYYLTLGGYTGYVNFVHVKPSITIHPTTALKVLFAAAARWRETTADAVYTQPDKPIAGTAGRGGAYTGAYGQIRADWAISEHYTAALEAVHFAISQSLREAGAHNSNYVGVELKYGW